MLATYLYSNCNICNIQMKTNNIHMKQPKYLEDKLATCVYRH